MDACLSRLLARWKCSNRLGGSDALKSSTGYVIVPQTPPPLKLTQEPNLQPDIILVEHDSSHSKPIVDDDEDLAYSVYREYVPTNRILEHYSTQQQQQRYYAKMASGKAKHVNRENSASDSLPPPPY